MNIASRKWYNKMLNAEGLIKLCIYVNHRSDSITTWTTSSRILKSLASGSSTTSRSPTTTRPASCPGFTQLGTISVSSQLSMQTGALTWLHVLEWHTGLITLLVRLVWYQRVLISRLERASLTDLWNPEEDLWIVREVVERWFSWLLGCVDESHLGQFGNLIFIFDNTPL